MSLAEKLHTWALNFEAQPVVFPSISAALIIMIEGP